MSNVLVDINYPDSDAALALCRVLDNELADAIPLRLWAWALRTQKRRGLFCATSAQLASIVRWSGDADRLVNALIETGFLARSGDEFRIKGWDRNKRFFSERERLRKMRETQKRTQKKRVRDADETEHSSSSSSSISDLRSESSPSKPKQPRRARPTPEEDPAAEVIREHRKLLAGKGVDTSDKITESSLVNARKVLKEWPEQWREALQLLTSTDTPWLKRNRWPLTSLIRFADDYDERLRNSKPRAVVREKTLQELIAEQA